jgi:hypothetical protein
MDNRKIIRNLSYFGSNEDIKNALGCGDDKIIKYSELSRYNSIEELLPEQFDYIIILIENNRNSGHWVCLIRMKNIIECFNSYGIPIDSEFRFVPDWIERWLREDTRYLSRLIKNAPGQFTIISNKVPFQSNSYKIATCSRWVIFRIEMARMSYTLAQFIKLLQNLREKYDVPYDELVLQYIPFVQDKRRFTI